MGAEAGAIVVSAGSTARNSTRFVRENSLKLKSRRVGAEGFLGREESARRTLSLWVPIIDEGWTRWILENYSSRQ